MREQVVHVRKDFTIVSRCEREANVHDVRLDTPDTAAARDGKLRSLICENSSCTYSNMLRASADAADTVTIQRENTIKQRYDQLVLALVHLYVNEYIHA